MGYKKKLKKIMEESGIEGFEEKIQSTLNLIETQKRLFDENYARKNYQQASVFASIIVGQYKWIEVQLAVVSERLEKVSKTGIDTANFNSISDN